MENGKNLILTLLILCSYSCFALEWQSALNVDHPLVGKIFDTKTQTVVSQNQLLKSLRQSRVVLIGEKHDNPDHHDIESLLLEQLVTSNTNVVFEMLNMDQQAALTKLSPSATLSEIKQQLAWAQRSWSWQSYGPLLQTVLKQQGQLIAGNINSAFMLRVYKQPDLLNSHYPSSRQITPSIKQELSNQVFDQHCGMLPRTKTDAMVRVQLARDAQMAQAIGQSKGRAILIAGGFHIRKDVSVAAHLDKNLSLSSLLISEVADTKNQIQDYRRASNQQVDFIWFTPRFSDQDYCAQLRKKH